MFELKPLAEGAIPRAMEKAERYRLLNEPAEAESICLDVLKIDPDHQKALITLLLALTDQFEKGVSANEARDLLPRIQGDYAKTYYAGIICERRAKALLEQGRPGATYVAYEGLREAMDWYEQAEAVRPQGNDDSILRWNACARIIMSHHLERMPQEHWEPPLE
jgi:tetratricopeptide (TPR) repeat protein